MRRRGLTDGQWETIEPLMPPPKPTGRPRSDLRVVVEGVLAYWRTVDRARGRALPKRFAPWRTVYDWFNRWTTDGAWDRLIEALQIRLDAEGHIDWDPRRVDGSNIRASRAAAGAGKKGGRKSPKTTRRAARAAGASSRTASILR